MTRLERATPILCVTDVERSVAYWTKGLGFTTSFTWGSPPTFAGVERDGVEVMLCLDGQGSAGTWMSIWVDDVDALHDELRASGADIRQAPIDLPWNVREMNVADPDGHRIRFSTETGRHGEAVEAPFGAD